ncbi:MAG: hypothetical protein CFH40_01353 [Alphaproteobacteria bacterium MarineAlpha10_Bin3]|nr:MAG: hypothetical protein CFH40_01353 [Alphaproteobacteria bacterium MarineAlpha10_Bin3]PPR70901.1 MAG: hypothetical protein CFH09_01353 [Alphaproteobacteria bacterium MarineAlpha4_Bin1]
MSQMTIEQALGIAVRHHQAGRLAEASDIYATNLAAEPDQPAALHLLGVAVHEKGDISRAHGLIARAVALQPDFAEIHGNLGLVLLDLERLDDAIAAFETALALDPDFAAAHGNLGGALHQKGRLNEALASHRQAISLAPDTEAFWIGFGACVQTMAFDSVDEPLFDDLLALLQRPWIDPQSFAPAMLSALRHHRDIASLLASPVAPRDAALLAAIPLLLRLMALSSLKDLAIEEGADPDNAKKALSWEACGRVV